MLERTLYALPKLLLLRGLEAGITHQPAELHDLPFEPSERPADTTLHSADSTAPRWRRRDRRVALEMEEICVWSDVRDPLADRRRWWYRCGDFESGERGWYDRPYCGRWWS